MKERESLESTRLVDLLADTLYEQSLDCVHCGLCLSSCPTYRATGRENSSPRGRIYLMRGLVEGRLEEVETLEEEAFLCLGCRACETACPSGVEYGQMLERTRAAIRTSDPAPSLAARIEQFALRQLVPHRRRLGALVSVLAWVQRFGIDRLAGRVLPKRLAEMQALLPEIPPAAERRRLPAWTPAVGPRRGKVALFEGCIMPEFFGRVNEAARRVLSRAGFEVVVPGNQGCCGALQAHSGDLEFARDLARANISVFDSDAAGGSEPFDAIIVTSAGCSAAMRESESWLGEAGRPLAKGVRDVLEFLDEVGFEVEMSPLPKRVVYDDPCHLIHAQAIAAAPRRLLEKIPELELLSHRDAEACCGAAGIYNLTHPEMSQRVLSPKIESILEARPELVSTANPGCAMQIAAGLERSGSMIEVVHPIELLELASRSGVGTAASGTRMRRASRVADASEETHPE